VGVSLGWDPLVAAIGHAPTWLAELGQRYAEPHRRYHGVAHIDALARSFSEVAAGPGWRRPAEVAVAILFHDAIYEPGRPDNEARSGALARERLGSSSGLDVDWVVRSIEATATHQSSSEHPVDPIDVNLFLDADVAILGAPPRIYERYAEGVFHEFVPVVGEAAYRAGRQAFVRAQLAQPALFRTPWFVTRYETQARANLARERDRG
jgi:predicted metal-dependent HD superfamily phosphohydrolase